MLGRRDPEGCLSAAGHGGGFVRVEDGIEDEPDGADDVELDDGAPGEAFGSECLDVEGVEVSEGGWGRCMRIIDRTYLWRIHQLEVFWLFFSVILVYALYA